MLEYARTAPTRSAKKQRKIENFEENHDSYCTIAVNRFHLSTMRNRTEVSSCTKGDWRTHSYRSMKIKQNK